MAGARPAEGTCCRSPETLLLACLNAAYALRQGPARFLVSGMQQLRLQEIFVENPAPYQAW